MSREWGADNVPGQRGRVAVVTSANTGIGFEVARVLAERGASVVLAVRNMDNGKHAAAQIAGTAKGADVTVQHLDLASLASARDAAEQLRDTHPKIDLLVNNAGLLLPEQPTTQDGFEMTFGTNHLGHFAFTGLLLEAMLDVEGSRVVTVSSLAYRRLAELDVDGLREQRPAERSGERWQAYHRSKMANLMFAYELQRRLSGKAKTASLAAHPGYAASSLPRNAPVALHLLALPVRRLITQSAAMGALPVLRATTDPEALGGQFYGPARRSERVGPPVPVPSPGLANDKAVQHRLWTLAEELTGVTFPV